MKINQRGEAEVAIAVILILVCLIVIGGLMWGCPTYNVYTNEMSGKADFVKAEQNRKIAVLEAQALKESATLKADAEVERAKGVAKANEIIGNSLKDNEGYLRYLWVLGLNDSSSQVIYVPTEANLPILEAQRLTK